MIRSMFLAVAFIAAPVAAFAMPAVGDVVGTNPADAAAALEKAGCTLKGFEAEGGMIEAKCFDQDNVMHEVYINPKTGAIARISGKD
ncbi:PepSY domain-containing protein [Martelella sp. FLE1502]